MQSSLGWMNRKPEEVMLENYESDDMMIEDEIVIE